MLKKRLCLNCSSTEYVVPIVYGYPFYETVKEFCEGKIILGGCVQKIGAPNGIVKNVGMIFNGNINNNAYLEYHG